MSLKEKTKGKKKCNWGSGVGGAINPLPPAGPGQSLVGTWGKITQKKQFCVLGLKNMQVRIFSKNLAPSVLSTYGPSFSWKIWGKSNESILRKKCFHNRKTDKYWIILYLFGLFLHKQEFLQKILPHKFWVLMIPQLHAKYQIKNLWANHKKNAVVKENWEIWPFWVVVGRARIFPKKFDSHSFEYLWFFDFMQNIRKN